MLSEIGQPQNVEYCAPLRGVDEESDPYRQKGEGKGDVGGESVVTVHWA